MTVRIALASLVIVAAAMTYPWQTDTGRIALGVAAAVVIAVFAWWRGQFVTTWLARRFAVWRRNHSQARPRPDDVVTALIRVDDPAGTGLSLPLLAGYLERYGVRCRHVRVTSHDRGGSRTTWVGVTIAAIDNLVALQARSPRLPLAATAEIVARRLADQLRETGLEATLVDATEAPVVGPAREKWWGVRDDRGYLSAYLVPTDERLAERLDEVWSQPDECWTTLELRGAVAEPEAVAACAFRTAEAVRRPPVAGLVAAPGIQGPLVGGIDPNGVAGLAACGRTLRRGDLERIGWRIGAVGELSRT